MGGQPAHRAAWTVPAAELAAPGYFSGTLAALDNSWLRPRWAGYPSAQEAAGNAIHAYLSEGRVQDIAPLVRHLRSVLENPGHQANRHVDAAGGAS
jgi:hypothetical protein